MPRISTGLPVNPLVHLTIDPRKDHESVCVRSGLRKCLEDGGIMKSAITNKVYRNFRPQDQRQS